MSEIKVGVEFSDGGRQYTYLAESTMGIGDIVAVPVGRRKHDGSESLREATAKIVTINPPCSLPLHALKKVYMVSFQDPERKKQQDILEAEMSKSSLLQRRKIEEELKDFVDGLDLMRIAEILSAYDYEMKKFYLQLQNTKVSSKRRKTICEGVAENLKDDQFVFKLQIVAAKASDFPISLRNILKKYAEII